MDVEHGTFTPFVLGTNGGMGKEVQMFLGDWLKNLQANNRNIMLQSSPGYGRNSHSKSSAPQCSAFEDLEDPDTIKIIYH